MNTQTSIINKKNYSNITMDMERMKEILPGQSLLNRQLYMLHTSFPYIVNSPTNNTQIHTIYLLLIEQTCGGMREREKKKQRE